jgi:hypothetical protein
MGLPILLNMLRDDRDDLELVRGALESLVAATATPHDPRAPTTEVRPKWSAHSCVCAGVHLLIVCVCVCLCILHVRVCSMCIVRVCTVNVCACVWA